MTTLYEKDWQRIKALEDERTKLLSDWRKALIRASTYRNRAIALLQQVHFWRERSKAVHWRLGEVAAERDTALARVAELESDLKQVTKERDELWLEIDPECAVLDDGE